MVALVQLLKAMITWLPPVEAKKACYMEFEPYTLTLSALLKPSMKLWSFYSLNTLWSQSSKSLILSQALKAACEIWLLSNMESQEDIVYPNDLKAKIKVDADLKEMFRRIELPRDMVDIGNELQKNGMKPATDTAKPPAKPQRMA